MAKFTPENQRLDLLTRILNAIPAQMTQKFDPQLHVTSAGMKQDHDGWEATVSTLNKFGDKAVAFFYAPIIGPFSFSLEIEFARRRLDNRHLHIGTLSSTDKKARWRHRAFFIRTSA